jgi:hypothetical protein
MNWISWSLTILFLNNNRLGLRTLLNPPLHNWLEIFKLEAFFPLIPDYLNASMNLISWSLTILFLNNNRLGLRVC